MSKVRHVTTVAATRGDAASPRVGAGPAGQRALPFDLALDKAAGDIAQGLFKPHVFPVVSLAALGFAAFQVALYLAA